MNNAIVGIIISAIVAVVIPVMIGPAITVQFDITEESSVSLNSTHKKSTYSIKNTGIEQGKNVDMYLDITDEIIREHCIEGKIIKDHDEGYTIIHFDRMSVLSSCEISIINLNNQTVSYAMFVADDRHLDFDLDENSIVSRYITSLTIFYSTVLVGYTIFIYCIYRPKKPKDETKIDENTKLAKYLTQTHSKSLKNYDETILKVIIKENKKTVTEIATRLDISKGYVKKRIQHMKRADIILEEKPTIQINENIVNFVKNTKESESRDWPIFGNS